ncbi:GAF and ANTAR domain-containing protein [Streptomyces sp. NPDC001415]
MTREQQLARAFVSLSDTYAADLDPLVLLDRLSEHCVHLVGADAAGVMVATVRGRLRIMAVSDYRVGLADLIALQSSQGPCLDCFHTGQPVEEPDLRASAARWPQFAPAAAALGYRAAYAVPLRVNHQRIGALNLLLAGDGALDADALALAQALADVASVALINWVPEQPRPQDLLTQVQAAVSAKTTLEMAKGMLAEHHGTDGPAAYRLLLGYSKKQGIRPVETARALVQRTLAPEAVAAGAPLGP